MEFGIRLSEFNLTLRLWANYLISHGFLNFIKNYIYDDKLNGLKECHRVNGKKKKKSPIFLDQKNHKSSQNTNWLNTFTTKDNFSLVYKKVLKINKNKDQQCMKNNHYENIFTKIQT